MGFCDASLKAYAAVVYLCMQSETGFYLRFLCAKTRIAPIKRLTIPRLELLSALLLSQLVVSVQQALEGEIEIVDTTCFSDSQVALCWIYGEEKQWKQFVQNCVLEVRRLVQAGQWKHCPWVQNPADLPSHGTTPHEFQRKCLLWLYGPVEIQSENFDFHLANLPEACLAELKQRDKGSLLVSLLSVQEDVPIDCEKFSSLKRLLRITAYVLKFVRILKKTQAVRRAHEDSLINAEDIAHALIYWLLQSQKSLIKSSMF